MKRAYPSVATPAARRVGHLAHAGWRLAVWVVAINYLVSRPTTLRAQADPERWNVISIVTDDQGAWALGAYGNDEIVTPHMDRLAEEGVRFTKAFAASGVCTPSRVALLTGLYPTQAGLNDVPYRRDPDEGLPLGVPTWPRVLQGQGYVTGLIGKWHLGSTRRNYPTNFGIAYFFGFVGGSNRPMDPVLFRDGQSAVVRGPLPDILVDDAMQFVQRHQAEPFALMLHFRAPHAPHLPVPEADLAPYLGLDPTVEIVDPAEAVLDDDQEPAAPEAIALHTKLLKQKLISYYASVHSIDRNLGRLLAKLEELNLARKTIILFTSDHGYLFGHRGLKGKGAAQPIRNHTLANNALVINMFDLSLRVPLIVRWPGVVVDKLVSHVDVYPTILGMVGMQAAQRGPQQGLDLTPLLRGEAVPWRDALFAEYTPDQIGAMAFIRMIRTPTRKLVRTYLNPGGNQLFDLENDPNEMHNLYYRNFRGIPLERFQGQARRLPEHPYGDMLRGLQERLAAWQLSIGDPALELDSAFTAAQVRARERWTTTDEER